MDVAGLENTLIRGHHESDAKNPTKSAARAFDTHRGSQRRGKGGGHRLRPDRARSPVGLPGIGSGDGRRRERRSRERDGVCPAWLSERARVSRLSRDARRGAAGRGFDLHMAAASPRHREERCRARREGHPVRKAHGAPDEGSRSDGGSVPRRRRQARDRPSIPVPSVFRARGERDRAGRSRPAGRGARQHQGFGREQRTAPARHDPLRVGRSARAARKRDVRAQEQQGESRLGRRGRRARRAHVRRRARREGRAGRFLADVLRHRGGG